MFAFFFELGCNITGVLLVLSNLEMNVLTIATLIALFASWESRVGIRI